MASLSPSADLVPATQFSLKQLTIIYNQTRVDYLVPMPMNMARMQEYIHVYDVDLADSFVAMQDGEMVALGMLGVRAGRPPTRNRRIVDGGVARRGGAQRHPVHHA